MAPPHHHYPQGGSTRIYVDENGYPVSASQQPPDGSERPPRRDAGGSESQVAPDLLAGEERPVPPALSELKCLQHICRRIRAGWLPHRLSSGSWWWGRPRDPAGWELWTVGVVPSMEVVEHMTQEEVNVWTGTLHPFAQELDETQHKTASDTHE